MIGLLWALFLDIYLPMTAGDSQDWVLEWDWLADQGETAFAVISALVTVSLMLAAWFPTDTKSR